MNCGMKNNQIFVSRAISISILNSLEKIKKTSIAEKRKVGAIVISGQYLYHGYNRMFDGSKCENSDGETLSGVLHAEEDAIISYLKNKPTVYIEHILVQVLFQTPIIICTYSPCINCAKLIINSGIKTLFYIDKHKVNFDKNHIKDDLSVKDYLLKYKVNVVRIDNEGNIIEKDIVF